LTGKRGALLVGLWWKLVPLTRTFDTMQAVVDQVPPTKQWYSDGLPVYPNLMYTLKNSEAVHSVAPGKSQTYTVEAVNADLRHYLARLARRNRCFSRCIEALRRAVWLFVYCYNRKRLFKHRYPKRNPPLPDFLTAIN
jgi:insertion element IS1 protein InsB